MNLIIFSSKHGTTEKISQKLKDLLGREETDIINLKKDKIATLNKYERIIIGSSIYMGGISGRLKKFMDQNISVLLKKETGLFLCCMLKEKFTEQFEQAYPAALRKNAKAHMIPGGALIIDKMNFLEKIAVKKVAGVTENQVDIKEDVIKEFAAKMLQ